MAHKDKRIGRTQNVTPKSDTTTIGVGSTTAVTLLPANAERVSVIISNPNNQAVWIRERPAAADNIKDGEAIYPAGSYRTITDNPYTGEISAIFATGGGLKPLIIVEK